MNTNEIILTEKIKNSIRSIKGFSSLEEWQDMFFELSEIIVYGVISKQDIENKSSEICNKLFDLKTLSELVTALFETESNDTIKS